MNSLKISQNDLWVLLLSLALSMLIWADGVRDADPEKSRQLSIPLEVSAREDAVLINELPDSIEIVLQAPGTFMQNVESNSFKASINLESAPLGPSDQEVRIDVVNEGFSADWITSQSPRRVETILDTQETKSVPVEIELRGTAAQGFEVGDKVAEPATIELTGPSRSLDKIAGARADVLIDSPLEDVSRTRQVIFYDVTGEAVLLSAPPAVTANETSVRVSVSIVELPGFKTIPIRTDIIGRENENYVKGAITINPQVLTVNGSPELLDQLVSVQTTAVDISGLRESEKFDVDVVLPEGVTRVEQTKITVDVEIDPIITPVEFTLKPELFGLDPMAFDVRMDDTLLVDVTLSGPREVMNTLSEDEVRVLVDVSGFDSGIHEITLKPAAPTEGIDVRSVQPQVIAVELIALNPTETPEVSD